MAINRNNRRRNLGSYAIPAGIAGALAANVASRLKSSYGSSLMNMTGTGTQTTSDLPGNGTGVTGNYDHKRVYTRKRMPQKKRQQWIDFAKKVQAVQLSHYPSLNIRFSKSFTLGSVSGQQKTIGVELYSYNGVSNQNNDLARIYAAESFPNNTTLHFTNATIDFAISNVTTDSVNAVVEIYHWKMRGKSESAATNFLDLIDNLVLDAGTAGTKYDRDYYGITPFDFPGIGSEIIITKADEYLLPKGDSMTYQFRSPKNIKLAGTQIAENIGFAGPHTEGCYIQVRGLPVVGLHAPAVTVMILATSVYRYKRLQNSSSQITAA